MGLSKGVDYHTYLSTEPFSVTFAKPGQTFANFRAGVMVKDSLQIDMSDIGWFEHTGRFQWTAYRNGSVLANRYAEIAPSTGNLGDSNMDNMLQTPSLIGSNYAISYGFYDAGSGAASSLTNKDQSYVYLTDNYSNWMGDLAKAYPAAGNAPFQQFALPGAHDAGMFDLTTVNSILHSPYADALIASLSFIPVIGALGAITNLQAPRIITNFAMTQKDNITTMLNLGIRYLDFRPGTLYSPISAFKPGECYHQHAMIPGYPYVSFLQDILTWLTGHPNEIVVVTLKFDGFANDSMKPKPSDIDQTARNTRDKVAPTIQFGNKEDLGTSYSNLLAANKRLIFLNKVGWANDAKPYDSYSDAAYMTTDPNDILKALNGMNSGGQAGCDYTVLQLQGTANQGGAILPSITSVSDASSPLMSTKASFDNMTYPWLLTNVTSKLSKSQLVVFLNDFADNCMTSTAITVTKKRMGLV